MTKIAHLIPAGDNWILEINGEMHSLRRALGVDSVVTLSAEDGLEYVDAYIRKSIGPDLVAVT